MRIGIYGLGYVGCVSMGCLAKIGHHVIGVDIDEQKVEQINDGQATIIEKDIDSIISNQRKHNSIEATIDCSYAISRTDISIICVGTPSTHEGHLNLDAIMSVAKTIGFSLREKSTFHTIAIRSTVLPGTCNKVSDIIAKVSSKIPEKDFSVVSNPEFLREGSAISDYYKPPYTLIGTKNVKAEQIMKEIYKDINAEIIVTDIKTSEIIKYINNSFHALKVAFGNEVGNICKALDINSHDVINIFIKDTHLNISPYYLKPGFAYGGSCLPKDLKALQTLAHDLYLKTHVINAIDESNREQINRAKQLVIRYKVKNISIFGISFKAGTDDLRNSPVVEVLEYLLGLGYAIKIYDPNINCAILTGANKYYIDEHISHLRELIYTNIDEAIGDSEMIIIGNNDKTYLNKLTDYNGIIFDLVRLDESLIKKEHYYGINW